MRIDIRNFNQIDIRMGIREKKVEKLQKIRFEASANLTNA